MIHFSKIPFDHEEPVMTLPGFLHDVAPQQAAQWKNIVEAMLAGAVRHAQEQYADKGFDLPAQVVADGDDDLNDALLQQDWPGFPQRYETALGALEADSFLRSRTDVGVQGQIGHEEYIEWRDVRDEQGRLLRVEMTTETRDYWSFLASVDPSQTLQLLADFARVNTIDPADVYGCHDPFAAKSTPALRKRAFLAEMARSTFDQPVRSRYNNGAQAIAFMSNSSNSLSAAINLTVFGAYPFGTPDGSRALTGPELMETLPFGAAAQGRNCDPRIFGTAISSAWDGRKIALADPAGIYINRPCAKGDLVMPDGKTPVPDSWLKLSRGREIHRDGKPFSFFQRLVVEPEPESGLILEDVIVAATQRPVTSGVDIARLVRIALYLKTSGPNVSARFRKLGITPASAPDCADPQARAYRDVHQFYDAWLADQSVQHFRLSARAMRGT